MKLKRSKIIRQMPARAQVKIDQLLERGEEARAQKIVDGWYLRRSKIPPLRSFDRLPYSADTCPRGETSYYWSSPKLSVDIMPACDLENRHTKGWYAMVRTRNKYGTVTQTWVRADGTMTPMYARAGPQPTAHAAKQALDRWWLSRRRR